MEVENIINENPNIVDVRVWPKKSSMTGNILMAEVIVHESINLNAELKNINRQLKSRIGHYSIPAHYKSVTEIKLTKSGKKDHRGV